MRNKRKYSKTFTTASAVFSFIYPLTPKVGTMGKYHPAKPPTSNVVNAYHVHNQARTFGLRSRV
jgi:hypothetical protein